MSESLREALIGDHLVAECFANDVLGVFADWLDRRAEALVSGQAESVVVQSVRFVKATALEKARDEIRQELRHVSA